MNDLVLTQGGQSLAIPDLDHAIEVYDQAKDRFLATRKSERTRQTYKRSLSDYRNLAYELETDPLRADCLIAYNSQILERRRDQGGDLANDTIRAKLKALQSFFSWCYDYNLTPLKPGQVSDLLTMPPARKLSPRDILTTDEAGALLTAARSGPDPRRNTCLLRVMLDGGLRVSEATDLKAGDVYPAEGRYYLHVARGKGDKVRDVEIPADLYQALADYAAQEGIEITDPRQSERPIFSLHRSNVWRLVDRCAKLAAIDKRITPHSLRHTHGHVLRLENWPIEAIADRLGHASIDTTKLYTRPAELVRQIALPIMPWSVT